MAIEANPVTDLIDHRRMMVCERLRTRRRELELTQKEVVARLRRLGVPTTNKQLSALEHGAGLDVARLPELARALECTLTWLVGLTEDCCRWEPDEEVGTPRRRPSMPGTSAPRIIGPVPPD